MIHQQLQLLAGGGQLVERLGGNFHLIAHSVYIDNSVVLVFIGQLSVEVCNHEVESKNYSENNFKFLHVLGQASPYPYKHSIRYPQFNPSPGLDSV